MASFFSSGSKRPGGSRQSGQVAVESALVMPLFVFLILGIMQLGLIAQARVVAKYAAYRAARVGAMNNADPQAIEDAAIFHLLPVLVDKSDTISSTSSSSDVGQKFAKFVGGGNDLTSGIKQVTTVICGPVKGELDGSSPQSIGQASQTARGGQGSNSEVDFDDPANQSDPEAFTSGGASLRKFNRTRLVVQIQLLYRMPIPFANWVIVKSYLGTKMPSVLMMPYKNGPERQVTSQVAKVIQADKKGIEVLPINVSYAMRMQSNFFLSKFPLPSSNDCISYGNPD